MMMRGSWRCMLIGGGARTIGIQWVVGARGKKEKRAGCAVAEIGEAERTLELI